MEEPDCDGEDQRDYVALFNSFGVNFSAGLSVGSQILVSGLVSGLIRVEVAVGAWTGGMLVILLVFKHIVIALVFRNNIHNNKMFRKENLTN